jgi:dihydrofolate reductase
MKVILVMVASLNGKTTRGTQSPKFWASEEDQDFFLSLIHKHNLFVMGSKTFLSVRHSMTLSSDKLRIVLTREPSKYQKYHVAGQLEFTNQDPHSILDKLNSRGYRQAFLLTGETLNTMFFRGKLIDEVWVTIEPKLFGSGKGIVGDEEFDTNLKLTSIRRLNKQGTLLLKYVIV